MAQLTRALSPGAGIEATDLSSLLEQFEKSEGADAARRPLQGPPLCPGVPGLLAPRGGASSWAASASVSVLPCDSGRGSPGWPRGWEYTGGKKKGKTPQGAGLGWETSPCCAPMPVPCPPACSHPLLSFSQEGGGSCAAPRGQAASGEHGVSTGMCVPRHGARMCRAGMRRLRPCRSRIRVAVSPSLGEHSWALVAAGDQAPFPFSGPRRSRRGSPQTACRPRSWPTWQVKARSQAGELPVPRQGLTWGWGCREGTPGLGWGCPAGQDAVSSPLCFARPRP